MALDKQFNMYSVDTGHFYSNYEKYLHNMNCKYRQERNYIVNKAKELEKKLKEQGINPEDNDEFVKLQELIVHKREKAKESKAKILKLLENKVNHNEKTHGTDHIRTLNEKDLCDVNVISVFESSLSRVLGIEKDELTHALVTVQIYYFDVFKDICFFGFMFNGEKYRYFTSSAGQIRKKKAVFIQESIWNRYEKTLMCGLTIDAINSHGGCNVNKFLAYTALSNSATDEWTDFDIDKAIVVDDFETDVVGTYDFVDEIDYSVTRLTNKVPIPHTDGAGMILPELSKKNFMVRLPWVKGLLGVFDFKKFIIEKNCSSTILDIYGKEHDIIAEDIQVIFTKSQFKMYKYYNSWDEYKECFKKYNCQACTCNIEEDRIKDAKINYQMLQTLTDISEEEIQMLAQKSIDKIQNVCNSKETMLNILGVTPYNENMTAFQKSLKIYPQLLSDTYSKDVIREVKNSLLKKYRSGKLEITGKYTFLLPDFYALCEFLFQGIEVPKGLLKNNEVYCNLFKNAVEVDCLRSPHLYKEHAIRTNIAYKNYEDIDRQKLISEWFTTKGVYTSTHDLISKVLMFDVDGDKSLVVADGNFINIAKRNQEGIVPLFYNMQKAKPTELNNKNMYNGLCAAFTGGNIGQYSNNISKIWNHNVFINGSKEEQELATTYVKCLCCQNNQVIDYAKTLYKTEFPKELGEKISEYTNCKLPTFFIYAKDKTKEQVEKRNGSFVNHLYEIIPNKPINTRGMKLGNLDYKLMMDNPNIKCNDKIKELYDNLNSQYRFMINMKDEFVDNLRYVACKLRKEFLEIGYDESTTTDMMVAYTYGENKRYKQLLWFLYGEQIYKNLVNNLDILNTKFVQCVDCNEWFEVSVKNTKSCRCIKCQHEYKKVTDKNRKK